jgi:hypothetical protein
MDLSSEDRNETGLRFDGLFLYYLHVYKYDTTACAGVCAVLSGCGRRFSAMRFYPHPTSQAFADGVPDRVVGID